MKDGIKNIRTIKAIRGERLIIDLNTTFEGSLQAWMKRDVDSPFYRSFEIKDNRYLILTKDKACDYVNNSGEIIEDISGKWYFDVEQSKAGISPEYSKTIYKGTILFQGDITGSNATEITEPLPQNSFIGLKDTPNTYEKSGQIVVVNETKDGLVYADTALLSFKEKQALLEHLGRYDNPHQVNKAQVGLSNVDNTSDINKPISTATQTALDDKASTNGNETEAFNTKELRSTSLLVRDAQGRATGAVGLAGYEDNVGVRKAGMNVLFNSNLLSSFYWTNEIHNAYNDYLMSLNKDGNLTIIGAYAPFTGVHIVPDENQNFKIGELVCIEQYKLNDIPQFTSEMQPDWRANYCEKNKKGIFGIVYSHNIEPIMENYKTDELNEEGEYIVKQKQVGEKREYAIACLGDMPIVVNDENGDIEYGDKLTVSHKVGEACKAVGSDVVVGIAGCSFNFKKQKSVKIGMTKE